MSVYLYFPDLNIEISDQDGHLKVRDLGTGEERQLATSSAEFAGRNKTLIGARERVAQKPDALQELDFT